MDSEKVELDSLTNKWTNPWWPAGSPSIQIIKSTSSSPKFGILRKYMERISPVNRWKNGSIDINTNK